MDGFYKTAESVYRTAALDRFDWLDHGFGTQANTLLDIHGLVTPRQIHSDIAHEAGATPCHGDALHTSRPGTRIGVKTADCLPILLVDERRRVVAVVHAGWRGTVLNIAGKTVGALHARYGTEPGDLLAAIGPGIGVCCFEVGPEVAVEFGAPAERTHIDLLEVNERQLRAAGVERVCAAGLCTVCSGEFHSYRRDRDQAGRMVSMVGIR